MNRRDTTAKGFSKLTLELHEHYPKLFQDPSIDFEVFAEDMRCIAPRVLSALFAQNSREMAVTAVLEMQAMGRWMSFGFPTFEVSSDMLTGLVLTDPSNLDESEVRFPFETFAVSIPTGFWTITSSKDGKQTHGQLLLIHSYIARFEEEKRKALSVTLFCADGTALWDRVSWPKSGVLGSWIDGTGVHYSLTENMTAFEKRMHTAFRRVAVNLALYVAEHGKGKLKTWPAVKKQRKRRLKRAQKFSTEKPQVWILGSKVQLGQDLIEAARANVGATKESWRLSKRFCVRGHYRNQACGPELTQRRLRWIAPYWKGPKDGERLAHLYQPKKEENAKTKA